MKLNIKYSFIVVLLSVLVISCNNDDDAKTTEVKLESFGPSGVKHGESIKFIGLNLDKVTSILLAPDLEIPASAFATQSPSSIELVIPQEAEAGKIILKTSTGDIESKTLLSFEVPVTIESITEEARPGADITITGEKVNWIEEVLFEDGISVTDFVSKSLTEVTVTVPMTAKTGFLVFKTGGTKPLVLTSAAELIVTLPVAETLDPSRIKHKENLTITGTDLDLVTQITFPGDTIVFAGSFVSQSPTEIVVTVPARSIDGKLILQVPSGVEVESSQDLSIILPVATELSPVPAEPGTDITITGNDLDLVKEIRFPGVKIPVTTFVSQSPSEIVVTAPDSTQNGALFFVTHLGFLTESGVSFVLPGEDLSPLAYVIFDDEFKDNWQDWSWGGASDAANSEQVRFGTKAIKKTYDGSWDGMQFGNGSTSLTGYTKLSVSVYGGDGTDGKKINVVLNENWGAPREITIVQGEWTEFDIPWSEAGDPASPLYRIALQAQGWSGTVYIDKVGFK